MEASRPVVNGRTERRVVAIHQPNFFPWLGFFDKLRWADVFILLDTVQIQKKGGSWCNRVKLLVSGDPRWVTAAIDRSYHGVKPISEVRLEQATGWREKFVRTLQASYGKAPAFDEAMGLLDPLIGDESDLLAVYNERAIRMIGETLGLDTGKIVSASSLGAEGSANELLINLVRQVDGTVYLAGGGASGYQEDELFDRAEIEVAYQQFLHPTYSQVGSVDGFVAGLSVIDALMNVGVSGTAQLLRQ